MKKNIIKNCFLLSILSACSSYQVNEDRINVVNNNILSHPIEARIKVSEPISGNATCSEIFFGIFSFNNEVYGENIQSDGFCGKEAVFDALTKSGADVIISPKYTVNKSRFLCISDHCLYKRYDVYVSGYKGSYHEFKDMDNELVKEYFKSKLKGNGLVSTNLKSNISFSSLSTLWENEDEEMNAKQLKMK